MANFLRKLGAWWIEKTIADVKRSSCKEYTAWRTSQRIGSARNDDNQRLVSEQTARRELEVLSAAIGYWHGEHTLTSRPEVWLPTKPESNRDALTRSQAAAFLWASMGWRLRTEQDPPGGKWIRRRQEDVTNRRHIRRYALIGFYTGTRSKVITSTLWVEALLQAWVDLERGQIFRRGRGERDLANKRRPIVRLPRRLLAHMRRWYEADQRLEAKIRKGDPDNGIAPNPEFRLLSVIHFNGQPIERVKRAFAACVADAGLPDEITPHWLRHTAATWLMEGGADQWEASAYLGMSPTMLENNYGHHRPDHQDAARRAIGGRKHAV